MKFLKRLSPVLRAWLAVFGLWVLLLSGATASIVGSPGATQAIRLTGLLDSKQKMVAELETQIGRLEAEREQLEKSHIAQEREIRKVLGYAAADEIIFDFTAAERLDSISD